MANEVVGRALIKILPDTTGFTAALQKQLNGATGGVNNLGKGVNSTNAGLKTMSHNLEIAAKRGILVGQAFTYGVTRPIIEAGVAIAGVAIEFDKAVRTVAAVSIPSLSESVDEFEARVDQYSESAKRMSRNSVFSATEAAEGMVDLARAGIESVEDIEAILPTVMNLATVEGVAIKDISDTLIQVFTGFGGTLGYGVDETGKAMRTIFGETKLTAQDFAKEYEKFGDILALTSQKTTTNITELGHAFRYAGPAAAMAGMDFSEASAALGVLGQSGFVGTVGGTALRGIITRLAVPTQVNEKLFDKFGIDPSNAFAQAGAEQVDPEEQEKQLRSLGLKGKALDEAMKSSAASQAEATDIMKKYGLEIFNTEGKMIPLIDIVRQFESKGVRIGDAMKLFGQRAGPAFLAISQNIPFLEQMNTELEHAEGSLGVMADRMKSTAENQLKMFKNALIEVAISIGESGLLDKLVETAQFLRTLTYNLMESHPELFKVAAAVAALVAAVGPLMMVIHFWGLGWAKLLSLLSHGPIVILGGAILGLVGFMYKAYESSVGLRLALEGLWEAIQPIFDFIGYLLGGATDSASGKIDTLAQSFGESLGGAIRDLTRFINSWIRDGGLVDLTDALGRAYVWVKDLADVIRENLVYAFESLQRIFESLLPLFKGIADAFIEAIGPAILKSIGDGILFIVKAFVELIDVLSDVLAFLKPLFEFLGDNGASTIVAAAGAFLLLSRRYGMAISEMRRAPLQTAFTGIEKMAYDVDRLGSAMSRGGVNQALSSTTRLGTGASVAIGMIGDRISSLSGRMLNFSIRMEQFSQDWVKSGKLGQAAISGMEAAMMGLVGGNMIKNAQNLQGALTGAATTSMGMLMAYSAVGGGPLGLALAGIGLLTTAITVLGDRTAWAGEMGKSSMKAFQEMVGDNDRLNDAEQAWRAVTDAFNEKNSGSGALVMSGWFKQLSDDIGDTSLTLENYSKALAQGGEAAEAFRERTLNSWVEVQKRQEIARRGIKLIEATQQEINDNSGMLDSLFGENRSKDAADYRILLQGNQREIVRLTEAEEKYNKVVGEIDVGEIRRRGLDQDAQIRALYSVSDAAMAAIESERVLGDIRSEAEAQAQGLTRAQYDLKTAFDSAASGVDSYRASLQRLTTQVVDPQASIDALYGTLSSAQGMFGEGVKFDISFLDPARRDEIGRDARAWISDLQTDLLDTTLDIRLTSGTFEEFNKRMKEEREAFIQTSQTTLGLSAEEASRLWWEGMKKVSATTGGTLDYAKFFEMNASQKLRVDEAGRLQADALNEGFINRSSELALTSEFFWGGAIDRLKNQAESGGEAIGEGTALGMLNGFSATTAGGNGQSFIGRALGLAVGGGDPKSTGKVEGELAAVNTVNSFRSKVNELLGSGFGSLAGSLMNSNETNALGVNVQIRGLDVATTLVQNFLSIASLGFQAFGNVITSTLNLATLAIVGFVNRLSVIPGTLRSIAFAIAQAFRAPIAFAAGAIWPPFALLMRGAAAAFGINSSIPLTASIPSVPAFHTGGVVGDGAAMRRSLSDQRGDEVLAMLKKGEGVLPADVMARMARADFEALRKGEMDAANFYHGDQIGGPYESGRAAGSASGMRGAYFPTDMARLAYGSMSGIFSTMMSNPNVMARVVGAAMRQVGDGFMEWIRGAGDAASEAIRNQTGSWPPGYIFPGGPRDGDLSQEIAAVQARMGQENSFPAILEFLEATGVPFRVTSTIRNSLVRGTGRPSLHNVGRAVDLAEVGGFSRDSPGLLAIYRALDPIAGFIRRIYSGPGGGGAIPGSVTWDDHHDHVHVSLGRGGIIRGRTRALLGEIGDEVVIPLNDPRRAMSLALNSGLFNLLSRASGPTSSAAVPGLPSATSRGSSQPGPGDPGFLGGGPGNTYNIYGVGLDQVKAEVRARDEADMRKVRR